MKKTSQYSGFMLVEVIVILSVMLAGTFAMTRILTNNKKNISSSKWYSEINQLYNNLVSISGKIEFVAYSFNSSQQSVIVKQCLGINIGDKCSTKDFIPFNLYDFTSGNLVAGTPQKPAYYNGQGQLCANKAENCPIEATAEIKAISCVGSANPPPCARGADKIGVYISLSSNNKKVVEIGVPLPLMSNKFTENDPNSVDFPEYFNSSIIITKMSIFQ